MVRMDGSCHGHWSHSWNTIIRGMIKVEDYDQTGYELPDWLLLLEHCAYEKGMRQHYRIVHSHQEILSRQVLGDEYDKEMKLLDDEIEVFDILINKCRAAIIQYDK